MWMYVSQKHIPRHMDRMNNKNENPTVMMLGTCAIWSLLYSDSVTPIADLIKFYQGLYTGITLLWTASDGRHW